MMTSEESRKIAARLRKCGAELSIIGADCETAFHVIDEVIGCRELESWDGFLGRLADLIDPTCRNTLPQNWGTFECSECGAQFEVCSVFMTESGNDDSEPIITNYCPECGARVVTDDGKEG